MSYTLSPFAKGVVDVPKRINGTAFFPGDLGLWMHDNTSRTTFPTGQIMVVGQDFNSVRMYKEALLDGTEVGNSATWRALQELLPSAGVFLNQCFFTNLYMGLREGKPETGRFPGARDKGFVQRCMTFFTRQLEIVRPRLVLTLGLEPIRSLAARGEKPLRSVTSGGL